MEKGTTVNLVARLMARVSTGILDDDDAQHNKMNELSAFVAADFRATAASDCL